MDNGSLTTSGNYTLESDGYWNVRSVQLSNNFNGGKIKFNEVVIELPNGSTSFTREDCTFPHEVTGYQNQETDIYSASWQQWSSGYFPLYLNFNSPQQISASAIYNLQRKIMFENRFGNYAGSGNIKVDNTIYTTPTQTFQRSINTTITAEAISQTINDVYFTFDYWSDGTQNNKWYNISENFPKSGNTQLTYYAHYNGKPLTTNRNLSMVANIGENVRLTWSSHPSPYVTQFRIYRKKKTGGSFSPETLLATVPSSTTTYTDYEYIVTQNSNDDLLHYDVRPYFGPSGTESDPNFQAAVFGQNWLNLYDNNSIITTKSMELPINYSIANYPNPFNPTTTINYQLPENGFVTIKVYDMLGKEIATLVNGNRTAGYHKVNFDASKLTSGIYIYTINAGKYIQSKKMLLVK